MKWAIVVLAGLTLSAFSGCCGCCRQNYCQPAAPAYPYGATYPPQPVMQQPVYQQPCACY